MSTEISDTKLFDEKEQSAEKILDTESNFQTPLSSAHANNINTNLLQDDHKPLASPSLTHGNNKDPFEDLRKLENSEQITMKLFQDFLLFLDEKTKHEKNYTQPRTGQKNMATTNSSKNNAQTYDHTAAN